MQLTETFPANLGTLDLKADDCPVLALVLKESYLPGPGACDYKMNICNVFKMLDTYNTKLLAVFQLSFHS